MPKFTLINCRPFVGSADLTSMSNECELSTEVEEKECTPFAASGDAWREVIGGIKGGTWTGSGFWEAGDASKVDDESWSDLAAPIPITVCPQTAAVGATAYVFGAMRTTYSLGGEVGDVAPWSAEASSTWPVARGAVLVAPTPPVTAVSFEGTAVEIPGGVPDGKYLYAALHIMSVSGTGGPTITALVESDNVNPMTTPTHRINFNAASAAGSQIMRIAGPITDTYFRVYADLTGTSPSFLALVSIGVA